MNNRINPYVTPRPALSPRTPTTQETPNARTQPVRAPETKQAEASDTFEGLSGAEQKVIERYFPASEALHLRVYGTDRKGQTLNPGALGRRLDISG